MDWRFLDGDGGEPNKKTDTVKELLKDIKENDKDEVKKTYFLLGVSGCGKTKAIFDVAKEEYVILLDFIQDGREEDILNLIDSIKRLSLSNDVYIDEKSSILVFRTFLSRFYLLTFLYGTKKVKSPKEWLFVQLDKTIQNYLEKINEYLQQFTWDGLKRILKSFEKWFFEQGISVIAAIDETKILLGTLPNKFMDSNSSPNTRPLSTCIISTLSEKILYSLPLIISGTHLKIADKNSLQSRVLKNSQSKAIQMNQFRCNDEDQSFSFLNRFLKLDKKDKATIQSYLYQFQGRSVIITDFITFISSERETDLEKVISRWTTYITTSTGPGNERTFSSLIHRFTINNPDQWEMKLGNLIYSYYANDGLIYVRMTEIDYMAAGFCFFKKSEEGINIFKIAEPLVVSSLISYMNGQKKSIINAILDVLSPRNDAQTKGTRLDILIPLSLISDQYEKTSLEKLEIVEKNSIIPEWFHKDILLKTFQIKSIIKNSMKDVVWNSTAWICPDTSSGNDGAICGKILVLTGNQRSEDKTVNISEVKKNFMKTSLDGLYKEETDNNDRILQNKKKRDQVKKNFSKYVEEGKIIGIIRIHFIFPTAAKQQKNSFTKKLKEKGKDDPKTDKKDPYLTKEAEEYKFTPGIRIQKNNNFGKELDEIIIDIDKSNLLESGIFSQKACESLLNIMVENKKRGILLNDQSRKKMVIEQNEKLD